MSDRAQFILKIGLVLILVAFFGLYGFFKSKDLVFGPEVVLSSPSDGQVFNSSFVEASGRAERISSLFLNGQEIYTDENGIFKKDLLLARGYNIIQLEARDKFNRKIVLTRQIILK